MNSSNFIDSLKPTPPQKSNNQLPIPIIYGLMVNGLNLVNPNHRGEMIIKSKTLINGATGARKKVKTFNHSKDHILKSMNKSLKGSSGSPLLTAILGIGLGAIPAIGGTAAILWTVTTTGISMSQTPQPVLARSGDEIWLFELLCKEKKTGIFSDDAWQMKHITYYVLIDPIRKSKGLKDFAWFIHEEQKNAFFENRIKKI